MKLRTVLKRLHRKSASPLRGEVGPKGRVGVMAPQGRPDENRALQAKLADLQTNIPSDLSPQITPLLTQLYARMTDRALALIPPPMPRTPRKPA